jgi:hypothetical protein
MATSRKGNGHPACKACGRYIGRVAASAVVGRIVAVLYPSDDPDAEWSPDTIDDVARVLADAGFGPHAGKRAGR